MDFGFGFKIGLGFGYWMLDLEAGRMSWMPDMDSGVYEKLLDVALEEAEFELGGRRIWPDLDCYW